MSDAKDVRLGKVVALWRYPVKSMMGEELNATEIVPGGMLGDRVYGLVDSADGKIVSAKNPRKWPSLFEFRAAMCEPPRPGATMPLVRITLPDGTSVTCGQGDLDQVLSRTLGRDVTLQSAAPAAPTLEEYWPDLDGLDHRDAVTDESIVAGKFFDGAPLHLLTTATLDRLRMAYPAGRFEARRFRPNIVVQPPKGDEGFVENAWVGHTLALGGQVQLKVTGLCPRCVMTTLGQGDLPSDPGILRAAVQQNEAHVGVYAEVTTVGTIHRGDEVREVQ